MIIKITIFILLLSCGCGKIQNIPGQSESNENPKDNTQPDDSTSISHMSTIETKSLEARVGESKIEIKISEKRAQLPICYVNLHENENTSVVAGYSNLDKYGGFMIELKHRNTRNIRFIMDGQYVEFDPNRIFTETGIRATLMNFGNSSKAAFDEVDGFRKELIKNVFDIPDCIVVSLHNNTNGSYSILNYRTGSENDIDASEININNDWDPDDFFFVTEKKIYHALFEYGANVVLQNNSTAIDDGSLSVYCGKYNIPYVNVEAEHNHLDEQVKMLTIAEGVLSKLYKLNSK